jgi:hypothetical protein
VRTRQRRLEAVGYWFNDQAPSAYPRPQRLVGTWRPEQRARVLAHLRGGVVFESYRAKSFCRFACGISSTKMGHRDLSDGVSVWPEGLAHYVEVHDVRLPPRFVKYAIASTVASRWSVPEDRDGMIDERTWIAWGNQQGASLDLSSWRVPDWAQQQVLAEQIERATRSDHPLLRQKLVVLLAHRRSTRFVCRLRAGKLAIVTVGKAVSTRVLAGWDEWPSRSA